MGQTSPQAKSRTSRVVRIVKFRPRLFIAAATAALTTAVLFVLGKPPEIATRLLIGWNVGLVVYIGFALVMLTRSEMSHIRTRAKLQDEGALALLFLPCATAAASLVAIFAVLSNAKGSGHAGLYSALAIVTITLSWIFIHTLFAFHYAHDFYGAGERANGLMFPECDKPDYWDFAYFSFVIGMTFQVSDVQVSNRLIRRIVLAHGALSFAFNTAILAVTVNLATSAL